ncbi:MAG: F0F1 ATP synthase subunit A [Chloroflexi bacterium]|nr:F0F1 ATP synthase subunit A [Chloroflexota bacterium]
MEIHASLRAEDIFLIGPVAITNSMAMAWATMIVLVAFAYVAGRNPQIVPRGAQNVFEAILEAIATLCENTAGHYARRVFPLIATLFIYILVANYMGLLPGLGTILIRNPHVAQEAAATGGATAHLGEPGGVPASSPAADGRGKAKERHEPDFVPLLRAANADVNMTLGMGLVAFIFIHASGVIVHRLSGYWKELSTPLILTPVKIIIEAFLPVSLSMRLFGNIFGGEMLLTVMAFPVVALPFMVMELLFGFIQALIFSMLTLIFTGLAVYIPPGHKAHGGHHEEGHGEAHGAMPQGAHGQPSASHA